MDYPSSGDTMEEIYARELTVDYDGDSWIAIDREKVLEGMVARTHGLVATGRDPYESMARLSADGSMYELYMRSNDGLGADYFCIRREGKQTIVDDELKNRLDEVMAELKGD
jgi:hypothetical protein